VTAHRVSPDSKYGARESEPRRSPENARGRELRSRSKHYEVTELPEEQLPTNNNRFSSRGTSRRTNNQNDQSKIKEKVYSSTYIPRTNIEEELAPEITTNAVAPEVTPRYKIEQEIYNTEAQQRDIVTEVPYKPEFIVPTTSRGHDSGRSRTRSRPPVASISEDIFQGRGERRKSEIQEKSNSELLRSRNRQVRIKNVENAKPIENVTPEQISLDIITQEPEAFIIPTEIIPVINNEPTESIEIPTEKIPVERQNIRQRPTPEAVKNTLPIQQERIPSERRQNSERQRNTERQHNTERQPNLERQHHSERQPTSERQRNTERQPASERQHNSERQRNTERQHNSERQPTSERQSNVERQSSGRVRKRPTTEATNNQESSEPTTPRVAATRSRSANRRLESFKTKKQEYSANIDSEPSRHQQSRNTRVSIDPVENVETADQQVDTRRVNRQGSRRSLETTGRAEQQVEAAVPTTSRRNVPRRGAAEPTSAAASTRYQFPGKQQTTLYTDDSGRRYLCIVLEDGVDVDQVVVNTKF
jgi:acetyl-CoA carboxylase/biotin carboxylase 1